MESHPPLEYFRSMAADGCPKSSELQRALAKAVHLIEDLYAHIEQLQVQVKIKDRALEMEVADAIKRDGQSTTGGT